MRKPEVVLTVLTVLGVSLLINVAFCARCLLLRLYFDASNEGSRSAKCLGRCLCISKKQRKTALRMTPLLPKSINWGDVSNLNGSYHGSAHLLYPSTNMSKMPLLFGQQSLNDISGMQFYPTGSLPGTLRRHGPNSIPVGAMSSSIGQIDMAFHQPLIYQSSVDPSGIIPQSPGHHGTQDVTLLTNYVPSYVRVPSINAPSPNLSQRMISINNSTDVYHPQSTIPHCPFTPLNITTPTSAQYIMRMQPTIIGGHVVYDDVAAGTSSMAGYYNRSPNSSVIENPSVLHHLQHAPNCQIARTHAIHDPSPLIQTELPTTRQTNGEFVYPETSSVTQSDAMMGAASACFHPTQSVPQTVMGTKVEFQQHTPRANGNPTISHQSTQRTGNHPSLNSGNRPTILPVNGVLH